MQERQEAQAQAAQLFRDLRAPTRAELARAKRQGDINRPMNALRLEYERAVEEAKRILAPFDPAGVVEGITLWEPVNAVCERRLHELWHEPLVEAARLSGARNVARLRGELRGSLRIDYRVIGARRTIGRGQICSRRRGAGRPAARRRTVTRSASASSDDPGGGSEGSEPPARLRLAPPPRAVLSYACLTPEQRGEDRVVEEVER